MSTIFWNPYSATIWRKRHDRVALVEQYLASLRLQLRRMTLAEREDIVREIRGHIREGACEPGASTGSILERLGPPEQLARLYCDGALLTAARDSTSPLLLLQAALRLATCGVAGATVLLVALFGYAFTAGLVITAFLKVLFPAHVGAWISNGQLLASGLLTTPPAGAQEVLGWNYTPAALITAGVLLVVTQEIIRFALNTSERLQGRMGALDSTLHPVTGLR